MNEPLLQLEKDTEDMSIYEEYFQLTQMHKESQGPRTIVLLNCGIFYEMYGYKDIDGAIIGSDIEEVCRICDLACTEKSKIRYRNSALYQAGFKDVISTKFIPMIVEGGYTAVMYTQNGEINPKTKKMVRVLEGIQSAGTYIPLEDNLHRLNNHTMVLWFEKGLFRQKSGHKTTCIIYGTALLNVYDGKTYMYEQMTSDTKIQSTTFDELEKNMSIFRPSEIVFISNLTEQENSTIKQFTGIQQNSPTIHNYGYDIQEVKNCTKQSYQKHILTQQFGDCVWETCEEFQMYPYAVQSLCYLLHFIQCRNANLIKHIEMPIFQNESTSVILANHTLRQLNIVLDYEENGKKYGNLSSVSSFLNKCSSAMGKRKFQYLLTHPTSDAKWLSNEYSMMNHMMSEDNLSMIKPLRGQLGKIRDIDKLGKILCSRKLMPVNLSQIYESVSHIEQVHTCIYEMPWLIDYLCEAKDYEYVAETTKKILDFLDSKLSIDACRSASTQKSNYDIHLIKRGVSKYLDDALLELQTCESQIKTIEEFFNLLYNNLAKPKKPTPIIKVNITEKNIITLQLTKTRSELLKKNSTLTEVELDNRIKFKWNEVRFISNTKTNNEISFPLLEQICKNITQIKTELNNIIQGVFADILQEFEEVHYANLEFLSHYVAKLDVLLTKCHVSHQYHYCCPKIDDDSTKHSFVDVTEIRHVLIERIQEDELFVTNDLVLGDDDTNGMMIFGTNMVGKTSLIRAVGICVVMAQAGMFVPCTTFTYKPYKSIYSRILGNDNLFKGLSTYAVEISELRTILLNADESSLVLGDELCSGTETISAYSIVMASLIELHKKNTSFMFASHFHDLVDYEEMKKLSTVKIKHMKVWHDESIDGLVYDRKLSDGSGPRTYGLEVCKSLYFPEDVLSNAYEIRANHFPEFQGMLSQKQTHYNAKKIKDHCETCGSKEGLEIHHLQEQHKASKDGYIDGQFHKNHPANLLTLCEKCHDSFHHEEKNVSPISVSTIDTSTVVTEKPRTVRKVVKRKTTKGVVLQDVVTVV